MRKMILVLIALSITTTVDAQRKEKWNIGFFSDVVRIKNNGFLEHLQIGAEVNYQILEPLSITSGLEYWGPDAGLGAVAGVRCFPHKNIFLRMRRVFFIDIGAIGAGWKKPIGKQWNFEAMADYYSENNIGLRVGLSRTF